jgi:HK97 family phage prohead protease
MSKELRIAVARELRAAGTAQQPRIEGYACTWGTRTSIQDFYEELAPKPFSSLSTDSVVCLVNHSDDLILGRAGKNLDLSQDDIGLKFSCAIADTSIARDAYNNLKAGILSECSFAFTVNLNGESWTQLPDGSMLRTLKNLRLWDVSIVTAPAYSGTSAAARNILPADIQQRMASARGASSTAHLGVVPFAASSLRSEDPYNGIDEANGIIDWADGEDENRSADAPIQHRLRAALGFLYVKNDGSKRSDYLLPHHTIVDGQLAHSQIGTLRAAQAFASKTLDIPSEHRTAVKEHLDAELGLWFGNDTSNDDDRQATQDAELRIRHQVLKLL